VNLREDSVPSLQKKSQCDLHPGAPKRSTLRFPKQSRAAWGNGATACRHRALIQSGKDCRYNRSAPPELQEGTLPRTGRVRHLLPRKRRNMNQSAISRDFELFIPPEIRHGSKRRTKLVVLAVSALVVFAVLSVAFWPWRAHTPQFRNLPVERRTITSLVEATGHLDVVTRTEVSAPAPGALVEALVQPGALVSQGQALARLDERAAQIALQSARAAWRSAKSREAEAQAGLNAASDLRARTERLAARGYSSESELNAARFKEKEARATFGSARAEREVAASNLEASRLQAAMRTIASPVPGIVLDAPATLGAIVTPERAPLFVLGSSLDGLRIDASIAESDIGKLRVGEHASFAVPAYPEQSFQAQVERVGVDATRTGASGHYTVELRAPNPDHRLKPGMTATLHIEIARVERALAVRFTPSDAAEAPPRSRIWLLGSHDQLQPIPVEVRISDGAFTEVRPKQPGALKPGDSVVVGQALPTAQAPHGPGISLGGGK